MIKVHLEYHKDGDHLVVANHPWWSDVFLFIVQHTLCPCCSWRSWIVSLLYKRCKCPDGTLNTCKSCKWGVDFLLNMWNAAFLFEEKRTKELYRVSITSGCQAYQAIFNRKEPCYAEDCEHCWEYREDAMRVE